MTGRHGRAPANLAAVDVTEIDAAIVAVTVYPDRARITRRGTVALPPGEHRVRFVPLPLDLRRDSVRVSGRGPATILGVDTITRRQPRSSDVDVRELTRRRDALRDVVAELADADRVEQQRATFIDQLAQRAGGTYARALAAGDRAPADVAAFADTVTEQLTAGRARQRELARRRTEAEEELGAVERELSALAGRQRPDQLAADVTLTVDEDGGELELELTYLVTGAGWQPSYDLRLVGETVHVTWFGLVTQQTSENWPECDLRLSTARPTTSTAVPELSPWYLDRVRPMVLAAAAAPDWGAAPGGPPPPAPMAAAPSGPARGRATRPGGPPPAARQSAAEFEQGVTAATYRPTRPVAVPADGTAHRAVVAVFELPARLDHVTAPVRGPEAHLRATVRNTSPHTLLPGPASLFHDADFVGSTRLKVWAPGEETELALGVDDRVRVERILQRREESKATLGSTRRREVVYRTTVANHTPRPATVTVLDQLPVSRDEGITVRELTLDPAPADRTELGELTWCLRLAPGATGEITFGLRVEVAKGVELVGWRE